MWEERYAGSDEFLFGEAPTHLLAENPWLIQAGRSALCVADGEGRNSVYLAQMGMTVTSFDLSPTAVSRARQLATAKQVKIVAQVSRWEDWDWSRQFDSVFGIFIQFAGPDQRKTQFADMARSLRSGGRLVLHGYRPEQVGRGTGGPPDVENMYTADMLREAFAGWTVERCASYEREQMSGAGHVGMGALIDFVAIKP
jgi:SAM-dependent methyltransferase